MITQAFIELRDLALTTQIGTYGPQDTKPDVHLLNLKLEIETHQVLIATDVMANVFDYDPLIEKIDQLSGDGHYETQERLMTRIAEACAAYAEIKTIDISLRKTPVRQGNGELGVRLSLNESATNALRKLTSSNDKN